jgi:hypothetical protein
MTHRVVRENPEEGWTERQSKNVSRRWYVLPAQSVLEGVEGRDKSLLCR